MRELICCLSFKWKKSLSVLDLEMSKVRRLSLGSAPSPPLPVCTCLEFQLIENPPPTPMQLQDHFFPGALLPVYSPDQLLCVTQTYTSSSLTFMGSSQTPNTHTPQVKYLWLTQCHLRVLLSHCSVMLCSFENAESAPLGQT